MNPSGRALRPSEVESAPIDEPAEVDRVTPTEAFARNSFDPEATLLAIPAPMSAPPAGRVAEPEPLAPVPMASVPQLMRGTARSPVTRWVRGASGPKRAIALLLPLVIALFAIKALRPKPRAELTSVPATGAVRASRAAPVSNAPQAAASPPSLLAPPGSATPVGDAEPGGHTLERRAVDEFATGNFSEAAMLYRRLAAENPGQPAFAVAARVAQARATGIGHD